MYARRGVLALALALGVVWLGVSVLMFIRTQDAMFLFFSGYGGISVVSIVIILVALVHVLTREDLTGWQQLAWAGIAGLVNPGFPVGAVVYFVLGAERTRALFRDLGRGVGAPSVTRDGAER